jgi:putative addiction module killer protein
MYIIRSREIRLFKTVNGRTPFTEWVENLAFSVQKIILKRVKRVALGNFGDAKPLGDAIYELRIDSGPGYRVYYGLDGKTIVLLLSGGDKSTQAKDIKQAKEYWNDYQENKEASNFNII